VGPDRHAFSRSRGKMDVVIQVVAGVLTRLDGTVLAGRRSAGRSAAGQWEFPGGKVEPGEHPESALARELHEELGLDVVVGGRIDRSVTLVGDIEIDLAVYRVPWAGDGPSSSTDHDELRWLSPTELDGLDWAAPDLPTVGVLRSGPTTD
jgi:mutator protein MutT